jgi:DNA-directed RNA polymerase subunit RPC12/RpoP
MPADKKDARYVRDGLWCPCCGYRLRTKPRNLKYKAKLRARTRKQNELKVVRPITVRVR